MVIDSSALIAILENETEAPQLAEAIESDSVRLLSAVSFVETSIVIENRRGKEGGKAFDLLLQTVPIEIIPVTQKQAMVARNAYMIYGKGRHPAKLNFGDCFSYALAKVYNEPLLFKGNDFDKTDIICCI
jgi:ribonuclease VapC